MDCGRRPLHDVAPEAEKDSGEQYRTKGCGSVRLRDAGEEEN